jgi:hypothetical protein
VFLEAIKHAPRGFVADKVMKFTSPSIETHKPSVLAAIQKYYSAFAYASPAMQDHFEVCCTAVARDALLAIWSARLRDELKVLA